MTPRAGERYLGFGWTLRFRLRSPDLHGSSVGEASARQISHCPQASKDAVWRVTRDSRVKGFSNVAEVFGSLTARGAEAWTSGGIRQQSLAIVGHFFRSGEMAFCFPPELRTRLQKGIWNRTTISLRVLRRTRRGSSGGKPVAPQLSPSPPLLPQVAVVNAEG